MSDIITVNVAEGSFTIPSDLLKAYKDRAFEALEAEETAKLNFKDEVEAAAAGATSTTVETKVIAKHLGKWYKARYKEATGEVKDTGIVFEALDSALD